MKAWRDRFAGDGLKAFSGVRPGRGRKPSIAAEKVEEIVRLTLDETSLGEPALELSDDRGSVWRVAGDGPADLVGPGASAASGRDVQAVKRSEV